MFIHFFLVLLVIERRENDKKNCDEKDLIELARSVGRCGWYWIEEICVFVSLFLGHGTLLYMFLGEFVPF